MDENLQIGTCRVCLRSNLRKCMSLFENFETSTIASHISSLVHFEISEKDGFPNKICLLCFKQLQTAVEFKLKCELSQASLLTTLNIEKKKQLEEEYLEDDIDYSDDWQNDPEEIKGEIEIQDIKPTSEEVDKLQNNYIEVKVENITESIKPPSEEVLSAKASRAVDLKLECHDCKEIFKSKCKLKVHWKKVHLPNTLVCSICKKKCGNHTALSLHKKTKICSIVGKAEIIGQGKNREFHCKECPYRTRTVDHWKKHYNNHSKERTYDCNICDKRFIQYGTLQAHKEYVHKLFEAEGTCHVCGIFIKGKSQMRRHIKTHRQQTVKCEVCNKILKNKSNLTVHMNLHSDIKKYACELCAHTTHTLAGLMSHKNRTHLKNNTWLNCDLCKYKCNTKRRLNQHRERHTSTNIPCTVCGRFYECDKQLKKHQLRHFSERNFVCNFCNKAYLTQDAMRCHIRDIHKLKQLKLVNKIAKEDATKKSVLTKSKCESKLIIISD